MVLETFLSDLITSPETPRRTRRLVRLNCVVEPINTLIFNIDKVAINQLNPGDAVVIFTPDGKCPVHAHKFTVRRASFLKGTHYVIARYAIERGLHVLVTKPATQLLSHHLDLIDLSRKHNVVCFVEHHKRFVFFLYTGPVLRMGRGGLVLPSRYDPVYSDARARARSLGEFNFFNAWMSQPKSQLETFRAWAGKDSDIR